MNPHTNISITQFDVEPDGTLSISDFQELKTRSEFYEDVADFWRDSPEALSDAMDECQPLAWVVNSIYSDLRDEIQSELDSAASRPRKNKSRISALKKRLDSMPEEPYEGAVGWLLSLTSAEVENLVAPEIENWFDSAPDWNSEEDYLPKNSTAQGAALEFFSEMPEADLDAIGVVVIEGEHPGSTYYAAELKIEVAAANEAAKKSGIAVFFKSTS